MVRMYFCRKKEFDYGLTVARLYHYGKCVVVIIITKKEDNDKLLRKVWCCDLKDKVRRVVNPSKKGYCMAQSLKAREIHSYFISHPL